MSEQEISISTRYPADLLQRLKEQAKAEDRSFNNLVIHILSDYVKKAQHRVL